MATVSERLAEAEAAYHNLLTGRSVVSITDQNGERVEFNRANASRLAAYIADLKRQLSQTTSGPLRPWF